jgi:hypothetical protein
MINGRGYPDTVDPRGFGGSVTGLPGKNSPPATTYSAGTPDGSGPHGLPRPDYMQTSAGKVTAGGDPIPQFDWDDPLFGTPRPAADVNLASPQQQTALVQIPANGKALLRISNLNTTRFFTLGSLGLSMKVVGYEARHLRGPATNAIPGGMQINSSGTPGPNLYYNTNSITIGGGESIDVIVDAAPFAGAASGTTIGFLYSTNLDQLANRDDDFGGMMTEIRIK